MKRAASQDLLNRRPTQRPRLDNINWQPNPDNVRREIIEYANQLQAHFDRQQNHIDLERELRLQQIEEDYETLRRELILRVQIRFTDFLDPSTRHAEALPNVMSMVCLHRNLPNDPMELQSVAQRLRTFMQAELKNRVEFIPAQRAFGVLAVVSPPNADSFENRVIPILQD